MNISIIAAVGKNLELGKNNELIWHFKEDMKFFKQTTTGHTVIMGRKTFESLPKALANRRNIVITTNSNYKAEGIETVTSIDEALAMCSDDNEVFVIGGGKIYELMLPYANKLYITEIDDSCSDADTFFPAFDKSSYQKEIIAEYKVNEIKFSHVLYFKLI